MKQHTKWLTTALALAGGLALVNSAQAQGTVLTDFHNFNLSVTYANWNVDGSDPFNGGTGFTPIITSGANGYEVQAQGYGSGAYDFATPINASGATQFEFTFTINAPVAANWMNPGLDISDGTHMVQMSYYNSPALNYGSYGAGTYTLKGSLGNLDTSTITAFNLEFDPAGYGSGAPYDITFKSLILTTVPEPGSLALLALGACGFVLARRRA